MRRLVPFLSAAMILLAQTGRLISVPCTATSANGQPAGDILPEEIALLDNGRPQPVLRIRKSADLPLTLGIILDASGLLKNEHRRAVARLIEETLAPGDQAFLVLVGLRVKLVTDMTSSAGKLGADLVAVDPRVVFFTDTDDFGDECPTIGRFSLPPPPNCGAALLWNGVYTSTSLRMQRVTGRKALVVLSDGVDLGSSRTSREAAEAAQNARTAVYTLQLDGKAPAPMRLGSATALRHLSEQTGGKYYDSRSVEPSRNFAALKRDLGGLTLLEFESRALPGQPKFHRITVKSQRAGITLRAAQGYFFTP